MAMDKSLNSFIEDVNKLPSDWMKLEEGGEPTDDPAVDPPVDPPADSPVVTEPVTIETPATTETKEEEKDERDATIEELRKTILELSAKTTSQVQEVFPNPDKPDEKVITESKLNIQPGNPVALLEALTKNESYLTQEELDAVIDKPELINKAVHTGIIRAVEGMVQIIPAVVQESVRYQQTVQRVVSEFYEKNSDLKPYADYVAQLLKQAEVTMKDKTYKEIFDTVAEESRKRLGLKAVSVTRDATKTDEKPAFAGSRSSSGKRPASGKDAIFDKNAADLLGILLT